MKNITLVKIAAVGGILTCSMGFALQRKISNNIKQTIFFQDAMNLVKTNKAAIHYLGEPIKDCTIQVLNGGQNYLKDTEGKYEVLLKGRKQDGVLHIYIYKGNEEGAQDWRLDHLELDFRNMPDKRLVINKDTLKQTAEFS